MPGLNYARLRRVADQAIGRFAQGPATLHVITTGPDGQGGTTRSEQDVPCKAVRIDYDGVYRAQAGIPDTDVRVLVARLDLAQKLTLDCEVTVQGERFRIVPPLRTDPADAHYDLQCRPV